MKYEQVTNSKTAKEFLQVAVELYKNDPNWIRPLDKDIEQEFPPKKAKHSGMMKLFSVY